MSTYTRGEAAGLLAGALAMPGQKDWLTGWSAQEIQCGVGCSHPQNNLWACGQHAPGSSDWNPAGVQNYPTLLEAIAAMVANLHDPNFPAYQAMLADLQRGEVDSQNIRQGLSTWCGSVCYSQNGAQFVSIGQAHAGDLFDDSLAADTVIVNKPPFPNYSCSCPCDALSGSQFDNCLNGCALTPDPNGGDPQALGTCYQGCSNTPDIPILECVNKCNSLFGPGTHNDIRTYCQQCVVSAYQSGQDPKKACKDFTGQGDAVPGFPGLSDFLSGLDPVALGKLLLGVVLLIVGAVLAVRVVSGQGGISHVLGSPA